MRLAAFFALVFCLSLPGIARAQMVGPNPNGIGGGMGGMGQTPGGFTPAGVPGKGPDDDEDRPHGGDEKAQEPPPAIPGALPDQNAAVAPADRLAADMSPNDALFDAIARGDLAAAKDALNRGAQLDAKNVLGQTPIDASIDLDRNDITFLLLSMRPAPGGAAGPVRQAAAASTAMPVAGHGRKGRKTIQSASAAAGQAAPVRSADRGQPNPAAGFIGF
jgi:hypothetical protein